MNSVAQQVLGVHSEESGENLGVCRKAQGKMQLDLDSVKSAFVLMADVSYQRLLLQQAYKKHQAWLADGEFRVNAPCGS